MRNPQFQLKLISGALALAAALTLPTSTNAATVTFNINSSLSSLTMSGAAFGLPISGQGGNANALVDSWSGTITADLTAGVLTFTGGSVITAVLNPLTPFSTFPNPGAGGVDNYGVFGSGLVSGVGLVLQLNGAYRSLSLDITSGTAANGVAPTGMNMAFTGGQLSWGAVVAPNTPAGGNSSMVGITGLNTDANLASLSLGTGLFGDTLTLPVTFHTIGSNRFEDWTGTIVAVVPEPSTLALTGLALSAFAAWRWKRKS